MVINYHTWWIRFLRIRNRKIIYGFHGWKIVLYLTMRKVRHAFTITIYRDLSTRLTRTWDTFYLWCRFMKPSNELCPKRGEADKKKNTYFFLLPVALYNRRLLSYRERSYFAPLPLLQRDLFLMGLFFYAVYMCWL